LNSKIWIWNKSEIGLYVLGLLKHFLHLRVAKVLLHEPQFELIAVEDEGNLLEHLPSQKGVKLDDSLV
jgi:hypothetical protein